MDQKSGFIRAQLFTGADVNETIVADVLIMGDEKAVYADKAYHTHARTAHAQRTSHQEPHPATAQQAPSAYPAPESVQSSDRALPGPRRNRFAYLKRICGYRRVRYFSKARKPFSSRFSAPPTISTRRRAPPEAPSQSPKTQLSRSATLCSPLKSAAPPCAHDIQTSCIPVKREKKEARVTKMTEER